MTPGARALPAPAYERSAVTAGIAHFGVGGFHRAHQAVYVDRLLRLGRGQEWGICAIGALPRDRRMIDVLRAQDGLYTVVVAHADGRREPQVVGSIVEALLAPDEPEAVRARLADPAVRVVTLTITEGGYGVDEPSPVFGHLVGALAVRRERGTPPFTVVSCDNLPHNGDLTRRVLLAVAGDVDEALAGWIATEVPCPNSMVDRITPATTPADVERLAAESGIADAWPVVCEDYAQWVLEDRFAAGRPPLEEVGVQLVDDVTPYEAAKLRLLNAGHQALAWLGVLAGHRYVHEACQDPVLSGLLTRYLEREGTPTLPPVPGFDLPRYRLDVLRRFANAHVPDTLARICTDGSDRMPAFLLPVVRDNLRTGGEVSAAALVVAAWAECCATDAELPDRRAGELRAAARDADPLAFLRQPAVFGDLAEEERLTAPFLAARADLRRDGARATVAALLGG
jgi:mannitol 2-dehydrogenase